MNYSILNSDCVQLKYGMLKKAGLKLQSILNLRETKMDLRHHLSNPAMLSRQHLEIYEDKLTDARGLNNHRNKIQR